MKPKSFKKRIKSVFVKTALISGLVLALVAFLIFKYVTVEFWVRAWEEVFGAGMALIAIGIIFLFTGKKFS